MVASPAMSGPEAKLPESAQLREPASPREPTIPRELAQLQLPGGRGEAAGGGRGGAVVAREALVQVDGVVQRVMYTAPNSEFAVVQLDLTGQVATAVAVGPLAGIAVGESLRVHGQWESHPQYGRRLRAVQALPISPRTRLGMERYLATLSGLGPELARRIVETLGLDSLDLLEAETFRVAQVKGVGKRRAQRALVDAKARREEREVMVFLQGLGVSPAFAARIRKKYGQAAIAKVKENPYALARDISGIGFQIADRIAQAVGIDPLSPLRCAAALHHVLDGANDAGHCYLPRPELGDRTAALLRTTEPPPPGPAGPVKMPEVLQAPAQLTLGAAASPWPLGTPASARRASEDTPYGRGTAAGGAASDAGRDADDGAARYPGREADGGAVREADEAARLDERGVVVVPPERIAEVLDELILRGEVVQDGAAIYARRMYEAEVELAKEVARLLRARRARVPRVELDGGGLKLAAGQRAALLQVETTPLCIITGGPGTGKTTIIRTLVGAWARSGLRIKLAAPTGRAAKRLSEATGQPASTLHRLLAVVPGEDFSRRSESDLGVDLLVCDEASMLDLQLALTLLRAVPVGATVVLVGDVDQLPSVGPGRVLNDLIESGRIPTTRLREIFRQAEGSSIVENAHRILAGQVPLPAPRTSELHDFYLIETEDALQARERVVKLVAERIPARFGLDPLLDVQVLTPMHRGEVGTEELNRALQAALNPAAAAATAVGASAEAAGAMLKSRGRSFVLSDKVMQVRNDYERDVWNGDVGLVVKVDQEEGALTVRFDDEREVIYDGDELDQLELAYAVSVHKAQGSEYKAVVIPLHLQHYPLLRRNLLYTAVTRGKKLVVLVGSQRALRRAVGQTGDLKRYTQLAERVRSILPT